MLNAKRITVFALICLVATGIVFFHGYKKDNDLPHILFPTMNTGVVYKITMKDSDIPSLHSGEGQQFYHILLKANQAYRFETHVDWLGMDTMLYGNGKLLGEMDCGYNSRCKFSVRPDKDTWALLKITGDAEAQNTPFTLEVRQTEELYGDGIPSVHTEDLHPGTLPVINTDTLYNGQVSPEDVPFYDTGEGSIQDYLVDLKAGQKVYISAASSELDLNLQIRDFKHAHESARGNGKDVCFTSEIPHDGKYIVRVYTHDRLNPKTPEAGQFTLKVSTSPENGKDCQSGIE